MDPKDGGFVHVVFTPSMGDDGEFAMEVCQAEPVSPEEAQRLIALFAKISAEQQCGGHGGEVCPICTPTQRDQVASAVRSAMRQSAPFAGDGMPFRKRRSDA